MANDIVMQIVGEAQGYVREMDKARAAALGLDRTNELLARHGVKTSETFREQLLELEHLTKEYKEDALAVNALTKKKEELIKEMNRLAVATDKATDEMKEQNREAQNTGGRIGGLKDSFNTLSGAVQGFMALQVVQFLGSAANKALEAERAVNIMASSVQAANREFGTAVGTLEDWRNVATELASTYRNLTNREINEAITRTVDMTKRLGLNADQMEVVIRRSVDLAAGKTDLTGAIERVTAALRGEAESAEYLGLSLGETALKNWLVSQGMNEKLIPALNDTQKAQLRYLMFLAQTNEMVGRAAELQETFAGKVEASRAKLETGQETLGRFTLQFAEQAGYLDLINANFPRYLTNLADLLTMGAAGIFTGKTFTMRYDEWKDKADSVTDATEGTANAQSEVSKATEETAKFGEQVAEVIKQIEEQVKATASGKEKEVNLLKGELEKRKTLQATLAQMTGADAERLGQIMRQNEALQRQINLQQLALSVNIKRLEAEKTDWTGQAKAHGKSGGYTVDDKGKLIKGNFGEEDLKKLPQTAQDTYGQLANSQREALATMKVDWFNFFNGTEEGLGAIRDVGQSVFGGFAALAGAAFDATGKKARGFWKIYKGLAVAQAVSDTYASAVSAYKAMAGIPIVGPGLGVAAAAGAVAMGLANVTRILSTEPGSGGGGGGGAAAAAPSGNPISSMVAPGAGVPSSSVTSIPPTSVYASSDYGRSVDRQNATFERGVRAMERAVNRIPRKFETRVEGDTLVIVGDRAREKRSSGLGRFE